MLSGNVQDSPITRVFKEQENLFNNDLNQKLNSALLIKIKQVLRGVSTLSIPVLLRLSSVLS